MSAKTPPSTDRLPPRAGDRIQLERAYLLVLDGSDAGRRISLDECPVVLGSSEECREPLCGRGISKKHAEIVREKGRLLLRDLGSTNGTQLNSTLIKEAFLQPADILTVGEVRLRFEPRLEDLKIPPSTRESFGPLYGTSAPMRRLFGVLERVAPTDASVLVQGESGCGKDLVARALHQASRRATSPFVVVDASAHTPELMASELFGHVEGAFTGAHQRHRGAFEVAEGGTVFLDEIGELPKDLQPKFLRVLENREVRPVGASKTLPVDVRIVAATNRDLAAMVSRGEFREDLYYRLAVVQVWIPPLRERREDLPGLIDTLLRGAGRRFTPEAIDILSAQPWKGNVRELRNVIERTLALASGPEIDSADLLLAERAAGSGDSSPASVLDPLIGQTLEQIEREVVRRTLQLVGGNQTEAARRLGMHRNGLAKMLKRFGMTPAGDPGE